MYLNPSLLSTSFRKLFSNLFRRKLCFPETRPHPGVLSQVTGPLIALLDTAGLRLGGVKNCTGRKPTLPLPAPGVGVRRGTGNLFLGSVSGPERRDPGDQSSLEAGAGVSGSGTAGVLRP